MDRIDWLEVKAKRHERLHSAICVREIEPQTCFKLPIDITKAIILLCKATQATHVEAIQMDFASYIWSLLCLVLSFDKVIVQYTKVTNLLENVIKHAILGCRKGLINIECVWAVVTSTAVKLTYISTLDPHTECLRSIQYVFS